MTFIEHARDGSSARRTRTAAALLLAILFAWPPGAGAQDLVPSRTFIQLASAEEDARSVAAGAVWDWSWRSEQSLGTVSGHTEALIGRWRGTHESTQIGLTPVVRFRPAIPGRRLFIDLGVGVNLITPAFRNADRRFSTVFNFGDHLGLGAELGARRQFTIELRIEHFSNAGIEQPNPGVNFLQLRLSSSPGAFAFGR